MTNEPCLTSWVVKQIHVIREDCDHVSLADPGGQGGFQFSYANVTVQGLEL